MAKKEPYERNSFYNLRPLPSRGTRKRNPDEDFILRGRRTPVRYTSSYWLSTYGVFYYLKSVNIFGYLVIGVVFFLLDRAYSWLARSTTDIELF